jgi:parvulin-like peptidyl-prolyl isomerase
MLQRVKILKNVAGAAVMALSVVGCTSHNAPSNAPLQPVSPVTSGDNGAAQAPATNPTSAGNPSPENPSPRQPTPQTSPPVSVNPDDIVATIDDISIARRQIEAPLFKAYGLNMLAQQAQLAYAKREARKRGIVVTPVDADAETERYLGTLFNEDKDSILRQLNDEIAKADTAHDAARKTKLQADLKTERNRLLDQLLGQQHITHVDFDIAMETNTYLRKIATADLAKQPITEEALQQAFNIEYGEKIQTRIIQLANLQEAQTARQRLAAGETFDAVCAAMSRDPVGARNGGQLPLISRDTQNLAQQFKDVAFSLKAGEVSDPVNVGNDYYIIKLDARIPPQHVKFEDVKDGVRDFLEARRLDAGARELRNTLVQAVQTTIKINDPILKSQFEAQVTHHDDEVKDRDDLRHELDLRRQEISAGRNHPATAPTTKP